MQILKNLSAEPELKQVYARMGFKPWQTAIPSSMIPLVDEAINLGRQLAEPLACWEYHEIAESSENRLVTDQSLIIESEKVSQWMAGCRGLYLTAVTLGSRLDERVTDLSQNGQLTLGFLLNAYGAEAAEALMESLDQQLRSLAKEDGFATTKRYSPGYGDWHIRAQGQLLSALPADRIGIRLTETFLMVPEKSVSAIIGVKKQ